MIASVGIISKENKPLYLRNFIEAKDDNELRFHYYIHTSLDIVEDIEEKEQNSAYGSGTAWDPYLGSLFGLENYHVYGYKTNTQLKFIVVVEDLLGDLNFKSWFQEFHSAFIATISNPFCDPSKPLVSASFEKKVEALVKQHAQRIVRSRG